MDLYVLTGRTESGDDIGPYVWAHLPSAEEVQKVFLRDIPEEVEAGTCDNWQVARSTLEG